MSHLPLNPAAPNTPFHTPPATPPLSSPQFTSFSLFFDEFPALYAYFPPYVVRTLLALEFANDANDASGAHNSPIPPHMRITLSSDSQFLELYELIFITESIIQQSYKSLAEALVRKHVGHVEARYTLDLMQRVKWALREYTDYRLQYSRECGFVPRVMRLVERLGMKWVPLSEAQRNNAASLSGSLSVGVASDGKTPTQHHRKFIEAFLYVIVAHCGSQFPFLETSTIANASFLASYCELSHSELLSFLSSQQPFIKAGLIELDTAYSDTISATIIKISKEIGIALSGSDMEADDYLKISGTPLSEVLDEEPGFKERIEGKAVTTSSELSPSVVHDETVVVLGGTDEEPDEDELDDDSTDALLDQLDKANGNVEDLYAILRQQSDSKTQLSATPATEATISLDTHSLHPYRSNIEYLDENFQLIATLIRQKNIESEQKHDEGGGTSYRAARERSSEAINRELAAKAKLLQKKCEKRLELTKDFEPRLEKLAKLRSLTTFDKAILLCIIGGNISHDVKFALSSSFSMSGGRTEWTVALLLFVLCDSLEERVQRRDRFYKSSPLIADGMIRMANRFGGDLMDSTVSIDRRILDYIVGLDSEFNEIVEGSHLYTPNVSLDQVVLPKDQKDLIVSTIANYDKYLQYRRSLGFDELISYGKSLVLLFYGVSGSGKTMLAKAVATHLKKKILLINFANLDATGDLLKFIFRESKLNDAILFFDECESFFETRTKGSAVQALLTEIENFDGLILLATSEAQNMDSAMRRRISLAIEFTRPDALLREQIWKRHLPKDVCVADDIDFEKLAVQFELTGGLIKNSVLGALSFAVSRTTPSQPQPIIMQDDLEKAAKLQLTNGLMQVQSERHIVPQHGLDDVVVEERTMKLLRDVVRLEKARKILHSSWGFSSTKHKTTSNNVFMYGPAGCGQSFAAKAIAFEVGVSVRVMDITELLARYSIGGGSSAPTVYSLFEDLAQSNTLLIIEISSAINLDDPALQMILHNIENYSALVIVISTIENIFDRSILRRFKFVIPFKEPNKTMRLRIWKQLLPQKMPLTDDVDLESLASRFTFNGKQIENVIFKAASMAVMESVENAQVTMKMLVAACEEELKHMNGESRSMYQ